MKNWERLKEIAEQKVSVDEFGRYYTDNIKLMVDFVPEKIQHLLTSNCRGYNEYKLNKYKVGVQLRRLIAYTFYRILDIDLPTILVCSLYTESGIKSSNQWGKNFKKEVIEWILDEEGSKNYDTEIKEEEEIYEKKSKNAYAYIMYLYGTKEQTNTPNVPLFLKVGKTTDINRRMKEIVSYHHLEKVMIVALYEFKGDEQAEMMESMLRKYFKDKYKGKNFVPKDRFQNAIATVDDLALLDRKANLIAAAAEL